MGFTFLEANHLLVDNASWTLTNKDGGAVVKCLPLQTDTLNSIPLRVAVVPPTCLPTESSFETLVIQRFPIDGVFPSHLRRSFLAMLFWTSSLLSSFTSALGSA